MKDNLISISRDYELFLKQLLINLNQFPRSQRYLLRQKIFDYALNAWENIKKAEYYNNKDYKNKYIDKAFSELFMLSNSLRLSAELGFLGLVSIEAMSEKDKSEFKYKQRFASDSESLHLSEERKKNAINQYYALTLMLGKIESNLKSVKEKL